jgi:hypothetical protein
MGAAAGGGVVAMATGQKEETAEEKVNREAAEEADK